MQAMSRNLDIFSRCEGWEDSGSVKQVTACDKVHPHVVLTFGHLSYAVSRSHSGEEAPGRQDNQVLQNAPAGPETLKPKSIVYRPRICALG